MSVRGDRQKQQGSLLGILQGLMTPGDTLSGRAALDKQAFISNERLNQIREAAGLPEGKPMQYPTAELLTGLAGGTTQSLGATDEARAEATRRGVGFFRRGSDPTPVSQIPVVQDISSLLQGIRNRQRETSANLRAIDARDSDDLGTAPTAINKQLSDLSASLADRPVDTVPSAVSDAFGGDDIVTETETTGAGTSTTTDGGSESSNANQAAQVEAAGTGADAGGKETALTPMEKLLQDTMKEFNEAAGEDTTGKDLEYYKKQFADATGVKIDGEPDKSHALMAFGLALMQNKAGKGFNVSNMLGAVGEAGQKAMPAFQKAKEQARAEKLAAGKFALNEMAKDKAAAAASKKAELDYIRELQKGVADAQERERLERVKGVEARNLARLETELEIFKEGQKPEGDREYDKSFDLTFAAGQGPASSWQIKMAYDKTKPDQAVLINADPMMRKYIDGRAGIDDALDLIGTMREASRAIAEGGGTAKFAFDRINSISKALFPDLNTGKPTSEEEYTQALNMIMGRFKRFLTQETGNGISNRDVDIWEREIMKKPTWFQNFDATNNALNLLEDTFLQKRGEFDAGLDHLYDAANHRDQGAFNELVKKYGTIEQVKGLEGRLIFKDGKLVRG